jgi:hypothetical protein
MISSTTGGITKDTKGTKNTKKKTICRLLAAECDNSADL